MFCHCLSSMKWAFRACLMRIFCCCSSEVYTRCVQAMHVVGCIYVSRDIHVCLPSRELTCTTRGKEHHLKMAFKTGYASFLEGIHKTLHQCPSCLRETLFVAQACLKLCAEMCTCTLYMYINILHASHIHCPT